MNTKMNENLNGTRTSNFATRILSSQRLLAFLVTVLLVGTTQGQALGQEPSLFVADGLVLIEDGDTFQFDETAVGDSDGVALTVRNFGSAPLQFLGAPVVSGQAAGDFNVSGLPAQIAPGGFAVLTIGFTPTQTGVRTASVTIPNNTPDAPSFSFSVEGVAPESPILMLTDALTLIEDGDTLALGETEVGQAAGKAVTLRNIGGGVLEFTASQNVIVEGPDADVFDVVLATDQIAPGGFTVLTIGFNPTEQDEYEAIIRIPNNDPNQSNYSFFVTGSAVEAPVAVLDTEWENQTVTSGQTLDFAEVTVGETIDTLLEIRNSGDTVLSISSFVISGDAAADYAIDVTNAVLGEGETLSATLSVTPSVVGPRIATLTIVNDGVDGSIVLGLSTDAVEGIVDCNENGIDDADDLLNDSEDCNENNVPDECEVDTDHDGVIDDCDNCTTLANADQDDFDDDGMGDLCDNCEETPNTDQLDSDDNGVGDACEVDDDQQIEDDQLNEDNEDQAEGQQKVEEDLGHDDEFSIPNESFCGAGALGMIPVMMCGLCSMRPRRRA